MSNDSRYSRQTRFSPIGEDGQLRLSQARALICGCGALGTVIAERLTRAGIGGLRIVDRDWVEESNLQRQTLFNEQHAVDGTPKAVAAHSILKSINRHVEIEPVVDDLTYSNISSLADGCDILLDGTDNFETRFLINDYCVKNQTPWVHGGCLGASGQVLSYVPSQTACFRCLVPELPPKEALETCDTAGVIGPAIGIVASWQSAEAMKILSGNTDAACRGLIVVDCWSTECRIVKMHPSPRCPACAAGEFPFLEGAIRSDSTVLCGKNAVQVSQPSDHRPDLTVLAASLEGIGKITQNMYFLRVKLNDQHTITVFKDGRTVVEGTTNVGQAKSLISQTLGG